MDFNSISNLMESYLDSQKIQIFQFVGILASAFFAFKLLLKFLSVLSNLLLQPSPRKVVVPLFPEQVEDVLKNMPKFNPDKLNGEQKIVYKWDPSTMDYFGETPAMTKDQVDEIVRRARVAQSKWKKSSFRLVKI